MSKDTLHLFFDFYLSCYNQATYEITWPKIRSLSCPVTESSPNKIELGKPCRDKMDVVENEGIPASIV